MADVFDDNPDLDRRRWHLNKGIDAAHLLTTVMIIVGVFWYFAGQDTRISQLELGLKYMSQRQETAQERTDRKFSGLKTDLRNINQKLDRLIERQNGSYWSPSTNNRSSK